MSFFRSFYCRTPHSSTTRVDSFVADATDVEEHMGEDGFVVFTEKKNCTKMSTGTVATNKMEYDYLQSSSVARSYPASGPLQTRSNYNYGSSMEISTKKQIPKHEAKTFITASDIPMKLAKHLELASTVCRTQFTDTYRNKPDIQQFYYDFHLEQKTLEDYSFR